MRRGGKGWAALLAGGFLLTAPARAQLNPQSLPPAFSWLSFLHPLTGSPITAVTPARDQYSPGWTGTCWAHITLAGLESLVLQEERWLEPDTDPASAFYDFSEYNLVQCVPSKTPSCQKEGRVEIAVAYLTRAGAVLDECEPLARCFEAGGEGCRQECPRVVTPLRWERVENKVEAIKEALYYDGPVITLLRTRKTDFFQLKPGEVFYWPPPGEEELNHGVLIVGYDDAKEVYDGSTLMGHGAWLVKNSNPRWGEQGFGWVAYGAAGIGSHSSVWTEYQDYDPEEEVYFYDEWGQTGKAGDENYGPEWGMVNYTIRKSGWLTRVDFWTVAPQTSWHLRIYRRFDGQSLKKLVAEARGTLPRAGYYSLPLAPPLEVLAAENIYVAVQFESPAEKKPVPVDSWGPFAPGRSYLSSDGKTWRELSQHDVAIRIRVKPADRDRDGMPDWWEQRYPCLHPRRADGELDSDGDGLPSLDEYGFAQALYGNSTNPCEADTDHDGLPDSWEVSHKECLNPLQADSSDDPDEDGVPTFREFELRLPPCPAEPGRRPTPALRPLRFHTEAERVAARRWR